MEVNYIKNCKGILLDLDHTLYDYDPCHKAGMDAAYSWLTATFGLSRETMEEAFSKSRKHINKSLSETASSHNRILYFQRMLETLQLPALQYGLTLYNCYWDTFLEKMKLDPHVWETLQFLKSQGKKICLVTDLTAHIQHRKIQKLNLFEVLDFMVTSEEAGREKPDASMFSLALQKLGMLRTEVVMVGDNLDKDIMGADNFGIPSFWLNRDQVSTEIPSSAIEIESFNDLLKYATRA